VRGESTKRRRRKEVAITAPMILANCQANSAGFETACLHNAAQQ